MKDKKAKSKKHQTIVLVQFGINNSIVLPGNVIPPVKSNLSFEGDAHLYEVSNVSIYFETGKTTVAIMVEKC